MFQKCISALFGLILLGACSKSEKPIELLLGGDPNEQEQEQIDWNGHWRGEGIAYPGKLWSVNFELPGTYPRDYSTPCVVDVILRHQGSNLKIDEFSIKMPYLGLSWFNARVVDSTQDSGGRVTNWSKMDFSLLPDGENSDVFALQTNRVPDREYVYASDSRFSPKEQFLNLNFHGPYQGTYKDDGGASHTATEELQMKYDSQAMTGRAEFWSYGGSVSHATDASCSNVTFKKIKN